MKTIFFCFALFISLPLPADELGDEVLKAFGDAFVETVKTEAMKESLNQVGSKVFETSGVGTSVFAAYGVYSGADGFLKSKKDSQKYYAATQTVAAAVGYFNPAIGLIIALGNVGQQLLGDLVTLEDQKAIAKTIEEIQKIREQIQKTTEQLVHSDVAYISALYKVYTNDLLQIMAYGNYLTTFCRNDSFDETSPQAMKCLDVLTKVHYTNRHLLAIANRLLIFKGEFVNFKSFLAMVSPDASVADFRNALQMLAGKIEEEKVILKNMKSDIPKAITAQLLQDLAAKRQISKESICSIEVQKAVNRINKLEIQLHRQRTSGALSEETLLAFAYELEQTKRFDLEVCSDGNQFTSPRLRTSFQKLTRILEQKNPEDYLQEMEGKI